MPDGHPSRRIGTSVPLPARATQRETSTVIRNVFIHMHNEQPILADLVALPASTDRSIRCTNVRTVDGKRPSFMHDKNSIFVFPLATIRMIEVPAQVAPSTDTALVTIDAPEDQPVAEEGLAKPPSTWDEEPDEDLLARVRSV